MYTIWSINPLGIKKVFLIPIREMEKINHSGDIKGLSGKADREWTQLLRIRYQKSTKKEIVVAVFLDVAKACDLLWKEVDIFCVNVMFY